MLHHGSLLRQDDVIYWVCTVSNISCARVVLSGQSSLLVDEYLCRLAHSSCLLEKCMHGSVLARSLVAVAVYQATVSN